jgi:hypothetical protein
MTVETSAAIETGALEPEALERDAQDLAEVFDETNLTEDGREIAEFDELPDVYDATSALGDDEDEAAVDEADFDPADFDEDALESGKDDSLRDELEDEPEDGSQKEPVPAGPGPDDVDDEVHPHQDELLDEGVEETFPASDPVSVKRIT